MIQRSTRLDAVHYELCGPIYEKAKELELEGHRITKLNIGNPAPFGFDTPEEVTRSILDNLRHAQGYSDHKGILPAREAIRNYYAAKGIAGIHTDDISIGNGVSELILHAVQGLLNEGDEVLVPSPDYPLWTAAVRFSGGKAVHYLCDEASDWSPDLNDIRSKINSRTKGIVIINPNNPTGAVYAPELLQELVELAAAHNLVLFSDEIYDRILYDEVEYRSTATFSDEVLTVTFSGLSKNYLAAGFRAGWMLVSGNKARARSYIDGLNTMASLRVCSNVPAQFAIQAALEGYQHMQDLVLPTGRLRQQRDVCYEKLTAIPGITCVKPKGAFYLFPKIDVKKYGIANDQAFVLDFLQEQHVLLVQGSGFNWQQPDHFRIVYLPELQELSQTMDKLALFLQNYRGTGAATQRQLIEAL
ncbi:MULTISPECIES: pyridoxal phosphate-dependent aminotransferase [Pontibacter]|uniref:Aminotransferase n=1 Tax=Pontibacter lucknowensis TaxID=1077936 RepID=A0A1N6WEZ0_9BACT|nr:MULTISPECIES: pyridoxal phosphate-dependent aminotransferase [Pontibacter]EJF11118.1 aminotransferase AlaT [Pontibacter sp. BAB1700]SIQ88713.1 alanine-synthesizing transaminase [Pontibacter lucknowensis]